MDSGSMRALLHKEILKEVPNQARANCIDKGGFVCHTQQVEHPHCDGDGLPVRNQLHAASLRLPEQGGSLQPCAVLRM